MRITWWLPVSDWIDWANKLLDFSFFAHTHYDQNLLLSDTNTKKYTSTSVNCDLLFLDRELFPIPDGYVEYDSNTGKYKIYYWSALQDLINIAKEKGILIANTGGMFSWYCCTRKGLIPSDISEVDVEFAWGWETVSKNPAWGDAEATQDIWTIGDKGQRCLYYYIKGVDPSESVQAFTDDLYAPLPFTGKMYNVRRALKVEGYNVSVIDIGFTPLSLHDYDSYKVSVTGVNLNCPLIIYGIAFNDQNDAINVILDLMTGRTGVTNYSVLQLIKKHHERYPI